MKMEYYLINIVLLFIGFQCFPGALILPPDLSEPEEPICASDSGLCHLAYRYVVSDTTGHVLNSPVCSCPGNEQCPVDWDDQTNAITKTFKNAGQEMEVKISYCRLRQPANKCRFNRAAVVMQSDGPFLFEIAGDFLCRCSRRLFAHRSWSADGKDFIEYSCGKSRCAREGRGNAGGRSNTCGRITYRGPHYDFQHEYFCRCRRYEECIPAPGVMPTAANPELSISCRPVANTDD